MCDALNGGGDYVTEWSPFASLFAYCFLNAPASSHNMKCFPCLPRLVKPSDTIHNKEGVGKREKAAPPATILTL